MIVGVLAAAGAFLKKVMTEEDLQKAHAGLVDALALAEAVLPMQWSTITTHMLLHDADWVTHIVGVVLRTSYIMYICSYKLVILSYIVRRFGICFVGHIP